MMAPNSMPMPEASKDRDSRSLDTAEMIDRLATEMRARTGGELPHSFYVDQVRRQLAGKSVAMSAANTETAREKGKEEASVFHAWAFSE
ncbi:hypothetical protein MOV61_13560 [Neorhizobium sp. BETTINA12A]|uniref:hypothetical protein n=1 Tax=unclassified Neorhizobium TaxID=2629175 RepID=UPI001FF3A95C|nr:MULTISPECIES: hypothetical protein [unclassified Neorhizobium]MCJ9671184.1 hypothetical protein [Neorhizobium sp. SHOUNA12B]MCJ9746955.1 hypothetical protein [Neorhizobium sp. SHOUNA12A]MCJ9751742.1 hypothetical protein [Neorhizobium sp. BETTINA12A]